MNYFRKRLTYANVMSSIAVFLVLGGGAAYAAKKIGSNQLKPNSVTTAKIKKNAVTSAKIKKNSVTGAKVKDGSLTGADINLPSLGTVPSAASVETVRTFSVGASKGQLVSLVKTSTFELMGFCDPNDEAFPPGIEGTEAERPGTTYVIYNRSSSPAFADTDDADSYKLELNKGVGFNYQDNGDGGMAMSTDGHFLALSAFANLVSDTSYEGVPNPGDNYPFSTDCHFAGAALVG